MTDAPEHRPAGAGRPRHRRRARRPARVGSAVVVAILATGGVALAVAVGGRATSTAPSPTGGRPPQPHAPGPTTTTAPATTTTLDPGALPQTAVLPAASGPGFDARMAALWAGVVSGSPGAAEAAFFPESAYVALKAESDPAEDFTGRLLAEYAEDLAAAHALLGPGAATARLLGVTVDPSYGHWVGPGSCFNRIGYFEMPNARVVYSVGGQVASFGIASMISWRGEWYVVHLGSVLRSGSGGQVDSPQAGPGTPAYSGTC